MCWPLPVQPSRLNWALASALHWWAVFGREKSPLSGGCRDFLAFSTPARTLSPFFAKIWLWRRFLLGFCVALPAKKPQSFLLLLLGLFCVCVLSCLAVLAFFSCSVLLVFLGKFVGVVARVGRADSFNFSLARARVQAGACVCLRISRPLWPKSHMR